MDFAFNDRDIGAIGRLVANRSSDGSAKKEQLRVVRGRGGTVKALSAVSVSENASCKAQ
jgi:hypothetical protein